MTNEELKRAVIDARKNSKYSEVLELASQTNYKKEPIDAEIAFSICHALFFMTGTNTEQKASQLKEFDSIIFNPISCGRTGM